MAVYQKRPAAKLTGKESTNFWLLTVNTQENVDRWENNQQIHTTTPAGIVGLWGQSEEAPTTGRRHLQICIQTPDKTTRAQLNTVLRRAGLTGPDSMAGDFRPVWTTPSKAIAYCIKIATRSPFNAWGIHSDPIPADDALKIDPRAVERNKAAFAETRAAPPPRGQGHRSDLDAVKDFMERADHPVNYKELCEKFPEKALSNAKWLSRMLCMYTKGRDKTTQLMFIFGETGTGKSTLAKQKWPDAYWLALPSKGAPLYWEDYDLQKVTIIDEYYPGAIDDTLLKRLGDHQPFTVPVRYGHMPFVSELVVFISNFTFDECFAVRNMSGDAVRRRFSHAVELRRDGSMSTTMGYIPLPDLGVAPPPNLADLGTGMARLLETTQPRYNVPHGKRRRIQPSLVEVDNAMYASPNEIEITPHQPEEDMTQDSDNVYALTQLVSEKYVDKCDNGTCDCCY